MDSLLDALQDGRLIELPDNDKINSLQLLAHVIEAIPSVPGGTDVSGLVLARENSANTALGNYFACPHARVPYDQDLVCSIGWSPSGINYGASDGLPVHIILMYLVPNNQRNQYLKEISTLAKTLQTKENLSPISSASGLNDVRNFLLDLVDISNGIEGADARARMIQLETRSALLEKKDQTISNMLIEPLSIVEVPGQKPIVLCQYNELIDKIDYFIATHKDYTSIIDAIKVKGVYEINGWRIIKRSISIYQKNRSLIECIAIKNI
jgi:mannitol/fructose-specific phosphotransferase system IIA component (Ntr-type)